MRDEYIRIEVEMGHPQSDGLFVVHTVNEEDCGPDMDFIAVLTRVMERIGAPHKLKLLAGVITSLGHTGLSATVADPCVTAAEEELIAAAHQLMEDWAGCSHEAVEPDGGEQSRTDATGSAHIAGMQD